MRGTITTAEAHRQYSEAVTTYRKLIPDQGLRLKFSRQVDEYVRSCVLGLWQADNGSSVSPRHVEFYNAIYTAGTNPPSALYWEVATGVAGYDIFRAPDFFEELRRTDRRKGTALARRFVDQLTLILLLFAAVDDMVSEAEAGFVNACSDTLLTLCDSDHLPVERPPLKADQFITGRPAPSASAPEKKEEQKAEEEPAPEPPDLDEVLAQLDSLCGLDQVKKDVKSLSTW